jgi:hypothetical protein
VSSIAASSGLSPKPHSPWPRLGLGFVLVSVAVAVEAAGSRAAIVDTGPPTLRLTARLVATGLRGAQGIRQVGRFHSGGAITSNPAFLLQTQAGHVLVPERLLVALDDNLGAPPADASQAPGTVLSIDTRAATTGRPLAIPPDLAAHPPERGAAVQLFSAQAAAFLNRRYNPRAATADFAAVAGPRYLSINNAFGRPWVANAPFGMRGMGSESVIDPDGAPLDNAPSNLAGGVFAGARTPRTSVAINVRPGWFEALLNRQDSAQLTPGAIERGALGTAFLGASPDGSGFATFAIVTGRGAVVQAHVQDGIDGLAPDDTVHVGDQDPGLIGAAFKWSPSRVLFLADPLRDRIVTLNLGDDGRHFVAQNTQAITSHFLHRPVDLAAAIPEIANPRFASHTTLAGDSDLYVLNRGDGSLLRLRQDGRPVARAVIEVDGQRIGGGRLRSMAVSADAQRLWLIVEHDGPQDCWLVELGAFDADGTYTDGQRREPGRAQRAMPAPAAASAARTPVELGRDLFAREFAPDTGLGSRFNAKSCVACHPGPGGASLREEHYARRVAHLDPASGRAEPISGGPSALAPHHALGADSHAAATALAPQRAANVVSMRAPLTLDVAGRLDEIPDSIIEAQAVAKGDGIKGRVHYVASAGGAQRVGRYSWKAAIARLDEMVANAMKNELGISSAALVKPPPRPQDDGSMAHAIAAYLRALPARPSPFTRSLAAAAMPKETTR